MTKLQMLKVLKRHRGELSRLAERADVKLSTVSKWFKTNYPSANIEGKVRQRVKELLEAEADALSSIVWPNCGVKASKHKPCGSFASPSEKTRLALESSGSVAGKSINVTPA